VSIAVRQDPADPNRWFLDFDPVSPGGGGGGSVLVDLAQGFVSIDSIHKNVLLPRRSTGGLIAESLRQIGVARPGILEMYNVERTTRAALAAGGDGQGTLLGNTLQDATTALGGTVVRWEPVAAGRFWHLRIHVSYP
jgi:hypothetical protein